MAIDVGPALGFSVDSAPLKEAKRDMEAMVPAADKAGTASERFRLQHQRTMDQMMLMQRTLQASLDVQRLMASSLDNMATSSTRVGQSFDRLIAKYDPLTAAGLRYGNALSEIDKAQKAGALSAETAARARQQELGAYNNQIAAVERLAATQKMAAQAMVNKQTVSPDRGSDIAAYATELDRLRAKFNPLFAAEKEHAALLEEINQASRVGAISEAERGSAISSATAAYTKHVQTLGGVAAANDNVTSKTGLARHELINLSRQAQDVAVSLQGGQGFGTVMMQQGSQIIDIFMSMKGSLGGFFAQAAGWAATFATSMLGAFTAVGAVVVVGVAALISYRNAQEAIQLSLMGIGRASGTTAQQLNDVGKAASSLTGLSTSEATEFATALAATGRVAQESLLPATQIGKNLAKVLGTDVATAAGVMGQALAGNLDQINARLGAFSVASQEQIKLLMSQNREAEAQAIVIHKVAEATAAASEATSGWSKSWTALGNAASNAWRALGKGVDQLTGNASLEDQYKGAVSELEKLIKKRDDLAKQDRSWMTDDQRARVNSTYRLMSGVPADDKNKADLAIVNDLIAKGETNTKKLKDAMDAVKASTEAVKANMQSVADAATRAALLPEIAARQALANQSANATAIAQNPARQSAIGISQAEADEQVKRAKGVETGYQTAAQKIAEGFEIANKAITAFSPKQKAEIAQLETAARLRDDPTMSPEDKRRASQEAYNNALKQGNVALSEAARARALSAQQAVDSSELEIKMVGQSIGKQTEMRANLQAYQALQQQASQQRTGFDNAEYERLKLKNAELGKTAQLVALTQIRDNLKEDRQTIGFSQEDLQIAQALRQVYPNIAERMQSAEAAQMRLNNSLRTMDLIQRDAFGDFLQNMRSGKSVMDSLTSALGGFADKLAKIGADKLFDGLKSGDFSKAFGLNAANDNVTAKQTLDDIDLKSRNAASNSNNSFSFNGTSNNTTLAGIGAVGAGVGIYGQSKSQTAAGGSVGSSVMSGALSGAMAGAALGSIVPGLGTLVGGAIGAVGGAIMGWFGGNSGANEAAEKARTEWAAVKMQAADFAHTLASGGQGSLTSAFSQARSQVEQYVETAKKAGDNSAVDNLNSSFDEFVRRSAAAFRASFGGVIDALNSGLGPNSPFASAASSVKDMGDQLKGFIEDTKLAFANDPVGTSKGNSNPLQDLLKQFPDEELSKWFFSNADSGYVKPVDPGAGAEAQIAQATKAAQNYLLSLLGQAPVLTGVSTAIQHLGGTATQLQTTLVELGMSSQEATAAIQNGVNSALRQLAATFTNGLEREINSALGQDYLNSTADLIAKSVSNMQDAASLGVDPALVTRWFSVSAQKIVDDAKLTGDAFNQLIAAFPPLQNAVHAFVDQAAIDAAAAQAAADAAAAEAARHEKIDYQAAALSQLSTAQNEYSTAQSALTTIYNNQANTLNGVISAGKGFVDQFAKLKASLRLNDNLSPLSAQDKYLEAQAQARATASLAAGGDATAQARLADDLNAYLAQSKSYNASTLAYYNDFTEVRSILDQAGATAQQQVDLAQQQLAILNQQVNGLISINNSVQTVAQGIANLLVAQSNLAAAQQNVNAQRDWGVRPLINQMIQRGLDDAGIKFTGNYGPNGDFGAFVAAQTASTQAIINAIAQTVPLSLVDFYARQGYQNGGIVGSFANGGMISNGIYGVDSVIARYAGGGNIALAGGEYVMPAAQTRANLPNLEAMRSGRGGGNDNSAVVAELRNLGTRLARIEAATLQGANHVRQGVDAAAGVQKQSAAENRQANNRPAAYGTRKTG